MEGTIRTSKLVFPVLSPPCLLSFPSDTKYLSRPILPPPRLPFLPLSLPFPPPSPPPPDAWPP
jgi:hypothetical protein